jgi:hypothetical protein
MEFCHGGLLGALLPTLLHDQQALVDDGLVLGRRLQSVALDGSPQFDVLVLLV